MTEIRHFHTRTETFQHRGFRLTVELPESSEALIDEAKFGRDERLPYWAELWPAARALARHLVDEPAEALRAPAIELGCGLGLPALVLQSRGIETIATDYYDEALAFVRHNAAFNGIPPPDTMLVDWRSPPDMPRFPLVIGADLLYEKRNAEGLATLLPHLIAPGGRVLIADPGRVYAAGFLDRMRDLGWRVDEVAVIPEDAPAAPGRTVTVRIFQLRETSGTV